jgi:hypothetical protein
VRRIPDHAEIRLTLAPAEIRPLHTSVAGALVDSGLRVPNEKRPVNADTSTSRSNAAVEAAPDVESQA